MVDININGRVFQDVINGGVFQNDGIEYEWRSVLGWWR